MDIAYYQLNSANNYLRSVCDHYTGGRDQYHCVSEPNNFDVWRTAIFLAAMHDSPQLRVIGVDGRIGEMVDSAITQLCSAGYLNGNACNPRLRQLAYETEDTGRGWFRFHHHHFHISLTTRRNAGLTTREFLRSISVYYRIAVKFLGQTTIRGACTCTTTTTATLFVPSAFTEVRRSIQSLR